MLHRLTLLIIAAAALAVALLPAPAQAQQACRAKGTVVDYHDKYDGIIAGYDNGIVRLTALGGVADMANQCQYRDASGKLWRLDVGAPMRKVGTANVAPAPAVKAAPTPAAASGGAITPGVYECDSPQMIGGMVMPSPSTGQMFGVTGPGTYRDFNGGRGTFSFAGDILTMTSGPLKGIRYRRAMPTLFYPLDAKGERGSIRCVLNRAKSLTGRW